MDAWPMIDRCRTFQVGEPMSTGDVTLGWTNIFVRSGAAFEDEPPDLTPMQAYINERERASIFILLSDWWCTPLPRRPTYETWLEKRLQNIIYGGER